VDVGESDIFRVPGEEIPVGEVDLGSISSRVRETWSPTQCFGSATPFCYGFLFLDSALGKKAARRE
jgi:hypothetical protein